ncbi:hypothetical protein B296_00044796, partial [Ensete ventricosum]
EFSMSADTCLKRTETSFKKVRNNGKVILVECVLPAINRGAAKAQAVFQLDLAMLAYGVGGKERVRRSSRSWQWKPDSMDSKPFRCQTFGP